MLVSLVAVFHLWEHVFFCLFQCELKRDGLPAKTTAVISMSGDNILNPLSRYVHGNLGGPVTMEKKKNTNKKVVAYVLVYR